MVIKLKYNIILLEKDNKKKRLIAPSFFNISLQILLLNQANYRQILSKQNYLRLVLDEEKNIVTIDNVTITTGVVWWVKDYRYGQSFETLPNENKLICSILPLSENSKNTFSHSTVSFENFESLYFGFSFNRKTSFILYCFYTPFLNIYFNSL